MQIATRKKRGLTVRKDAWMLIGFWGTVALGILIDTGCTVTKDNYETLSLFFDGVPNPASLEGGTVKPGDATLTAIVRQHKPFVDNKCEACHKTRYRPSRNDGSICLECHEKVLTEHSWTHGAVAGRACLWCHSPHESARKWLLRGPDRKVCAQCHAGTLSASTTVAAHTDENVSCVACHFGHGGDNSLMLKPGASATTIGTEVETPVSVDSGNGEASSSDASPSDATPSDAPTPPTDQPHDIAPAQDGPAGAGPAKQAPAHEPQGARGV